MSENIEENENFEEELKKIQFRLRKIHENQQISMCCVFISLFTIILLLWFSPTF